jgi:ElaB/YqjD/DUF883 family membrane-anchored ribosome-binding protein
MTDAPRNDLAALAGLAFAGIAAYAGYRAIDAERKLADPAAKPLKDHILDTARSDLAKLRDGLEECLDKAAATLKEFAEAAESRAEDLKDRATEAAHGAAETARDAADDVAAATDRTAH